MNDLKVFKSTEFGELGVLTIEGKEYLQEYGIRVSLFSIGRYSQKLFEI